ncbi:hypothetical protein EPO05_02740 [Patescibacteria group bacterium]|nr:MAG: hypothetical protein EPO05_02740 [Patescibacteria group bacterium]
MAKPSEMVGIVGQFLLGLFPPNLAMGGGTDENVRLRLLVEVAFAGIPRIEAEPFAMQVMGEPLTGLEPFLRLDDEQFMTVAERFLKAYYDGEGEEMDHRKHDFLGDAEDARLTPGDTARIRSLIWSD